MHEVHAAEALVERLESELERESLDRIAEVRVRASVVFSPEALQQSYEMLVSETALRGSRLVVEELPDERECPSCGGVWTISRDDVTGHVLVCPSCGGLSSIEGGSGIEVAAVR